MVCRSLLWFPVAAALSISPPSPMIPLVYHLHSRKAWIWFQLVMLHYIQRRETNQDQNCIESPASSPWRQTCSLHTAKSWLRTNKHTEWESSRWRISTQINMGRVAAQKLHIQKGFCYSEHSAGAKGDVCFWMKPLGPSHYRCQCGVWHLFKHLKQPLLTPPDKWHLTDPTILLQKCYFIFSFVTWYEDIWGFLASTPASFNPDISVFLILMTTVFSWSGNGNDLFTWLLGAGNTTWNLHNVLSP